MEINKTVAQITLKTLIYLEGTEKNNKKINAE